MNTEQRVLAMLNKVQNVRLSKKENLGAIEDAIAEVKNNADLLLSELDTIQKELQAELFDAVDKILAESDYMISAVGSASSQFDEKLNEYNTIVEELSALNIDYNSGDFKQIQDNMTESINASNKVASMTEITFF